MIKYKITAILLILCVFAKAQDSSSLSFIPISTDTVPVDKLSVGVGGGYEYGGIGGNVTYYLTRGIGVFAGAGYPLTKFGFNAGFKFRIVVDESSAKFMPYLLVMYGYNGTVVIPTYHAKDKIFYGATIGVGVDFRPGNSKFGYISASVYIPFRSGVREYVDYLNYTNAITYSTSRIYPLSASIGYKFILQNYKPSPTPVLLP